MCATKDIYLMDTKFSKKLNNKKTITFKEASCLSFLVLCFVLFSIFQFLIFVTIFEKILPNLVLNKR